MKKLIYLVLLLGFTWYNANGQTVSQDKFGIVDLSGKLKLWVDSSNRHTCLKVLSDRARFEPIIHKDPSVRFNVNKKNNWVVFDIINTSNKPILSYLKSSHPFSDYYAVFVISNGVILDSANFEYEKKLKQNFVKSARTPVFEHNLRPNSTTTFALRIRNEAGSLVHTFDFYDTDSFLKDNTISQVMYTIFYGIGLTLFLVALAFYVISKSGIYLYYAFYVILVNLGFQGIVGNLNMFFTPKIDFLLGDSSFRFYVPLSLIFNVLFLNRFFEIEKHDIWYRRFSILIILLASVTVILTALDWGVIYYKLNRLIAPEPLFVSFILFTFIYNYKRKPDAFRLYTISFLPIMILLFWRILISIGLLPQPTYFAVFFLIGLVFEILVLLIGLSYNFLKRLYAQKKLEQDIITKQIETQEQERRIIAADLHDDLGATLSLLNRKARKENFTEENQKLIEKAIKDLRSISRNLLPSDFEAFGLIASAEKYLKSLNEQQTVKFTFITFGERVPLKHDTELNIYRIVTELSNNVMKHSEAKNATVQLIYHHDHLFVSVEDDGKGLNITKDNLGIGLKNVISRIEYLQAKVLELGTGPICSYVFEVPYEPHKP